MLLTLRGTPFLYYGEEIGMPSSSVPRKRLRDPVGIRFWPFPVGRDCARTPMQWNSGAYAGFSRVEPWLPVDKSYKKVNVETQIREQNSLLGFYRRLLRLRKEKPALQVGKYRALPGSDMGMFAYFREGEEDRIAVLLNFTNRPFTLNGKAARIEGGPWRILLSTYPGKEGGFLPDGIILDPGEAIIMEEIKELEK